MVHKSIFLMVCTMFVTGCGGSNDGNVSVSSSPVRLFTDGAGVGAFTGIADNQKSTGYLVSPELLIILDELEKSQELVDVDFDLALIKTGPKTVIRGGAASFDGIGVNVTAILTEKEDVAAAFIEYPTLNTFLLMTEGPSVTAIPSSGEAIYTGTMGLTPRMDPSRFELGSFEATVGFGTKNATVTFEGSTASFSANGSAGISNGRFASSTMNIGTPNGTIAGSLRGDLHSEGAADMAGVIFSNDAAGSFVGTFAGSK